MDNATCAGCGAQTFARYLDHFGECADCQERVAETLRPRLGVWVAAGSLCNGVLTEVRA